MNRAKAILDTLERHWLEVLLVLVLLVFVSLNHGCSLDAEVVSDVDSRLGTVENRVEKINGDMGGVVAKVFAEFKAQLTASLSAQVAGLAQKADQVAGDLAAFKAEITNRVGSVESKSSQSGFINLNSTGGSGLALAALCALLTIAAVRLWIRGNYWKEQFGAVAAVIEAHGEANKEVIENKVARQAASETPAGKLIHKIKRQGDGTK